VSCPANSRGTSIPSGCTCEVGYTGTCTKRVGTPYYTGGCSKLAVGSQKTDAAAQSAKGVGNLPHADETGATSSGSNNGSINAIAIGAAIGAVVLLVVAIMIKKYRKRPAKPIKPDLALDWDDADTKM